MMTRASFPLAVMLGLSVCAAASEAQGRQSPSLNIYVIDVEGGNATLIVSPSGESLLIDTGNPSNGRDADRIIAAATDAGVRQIDHLIHALHPRVAIMNNGTRKGGEPEVMKTIYSSPALDDLWQIHFSLLSGQEYTTPGVFIANTVDEQPPVMPIAAMPAPAGAAPPPPAHNGRAYWIKLSAERDGSYTVTNTRNGFSKTYKPAK